MLSIADRHPLFKWCGLIFQSGTCCLSKIQGTSDLGGSNKHSGVSKGILFTKSVFWRKRENCPSQKLYLALFFFFFPLEAFCQSASWNTQLSHWLGCYVHLHYGKALQEAPVSSRAKIFLLLTAVAMLQICSWLLMQFKWPSLSKAVRGHKVLPALSSLPLGGELWAAGPAWGVLSQLLPPSSLQIATAEIQVRLRADAELIAP